MTDPYSFNVWSFYFEAMWHGAKLFDVRRMPHPGYIPPLAGSRVFFYETHTDGVVRTGRALHVKTSYLLSHDARVIPPEYFVLGWRASDMLRSP